MTIEKFVSPFIAQQFPAFYKEEGPNFIAFLKAYYEWMESTGQTLNHARSLMEYADIDTTGRTPILSGDFGSVQLDPKDKLMYGADGNIKVGTDLLGENEVGINPGSRGRSSGGMNVDYNQMASIIAAAVAGAMTKVPLQVNTAVKLNERELTNGVNNENLKGSSKVP